MSSTPADLGLSLTHCRLHVRDTAALTDFYTKVFGMRQIYTYYDTKSSQTITLLAYLEKERSCDQSDRKAHDQNCTYLELTACQSQENKGIEDIRPEKEFRVNCEESRGSYWKIGVNLYDLESAAKRLKMAGVEVTDPVMIPNVGLLCHVLDPEGYDTELMQFTFQGSILPHVKHELSTIGQDAVFSVITLRVKDMSKSFRFYQDILGFQSVCRQDQTDYGLDIYYLSCKQEQPPSRDIQALDNVEWTYQRPYTLLELVANTKPGEHALGYQKLAAGQCGFKGLGMSCCNLATLRQHLRGHGIQFTESFYLEDTAAIYTEDPDNIPIRFVAI